MTRLQSQLYVRLQALQEKHMTQEERGTLSIWAHGDRVGGVKLGRLLSRLKKLADDDSACQLLLAGTSAALHAHGGLTCASHFSAATDT